MVSNIADLSALLAKVQTLFYYRGSFAKNPSVNILDVVEANMQPILTRTVSNRLSFFLIEAVQNIEKYSANYKPENDHMLFFRQDNDMILATQNVVENKNLPELQDKLESITGIDKEELNELYFQHLKQPLAEKRSPKLGLIQMTRKGYVKPEFRFEPLDDDYSVYTLILRIPDQEREGEKEDAIKYEDVLAVTNKLFDGFESGMFYSGGFSNDALIPITKMLNNLNTGEENYYNAKYHHSLVEMIQNINKYGKTYKDRKVGWFILRENENVTELSACNLADSGEIERLTEYVAEINDYSEQQLRDKYKENLLDFESNGGLGFLDMVKATKPNPLTINKFKDATLGELLYIGSRFTNDV